jgi:hypothetical protein
MIAIKTIACCILPIITRHLHTHKLKSILNKMRKLELSQLVLYFVPP